MEAGFSNGQKAAMIGAAVALFAAYTVCVDAGPIALRKPHPVGAPAAAGKLLYQKYNCQACHQIYGLGGYMGPDLTNVYSAPRQRAGVHRRVSAKRHGADAELSPERARRLGFGGVLGARRCDGHISHSRTTGRRGMVRSSSTASPIGRRALRSCCWGSQPIGRGVLRLHRGDAVRLLRIRELVPFVRTGRCTSRSSWRGYSSARSAASTITCPSGAEAGGRRRDAEGPLRPVGHRRHLYLGVLLLRDVRRARVLGVSARFLRVHRRSRGSIFADQFLPYRSGACAGGGRSMSGCGRPGSCSS